MRGSELEIRPNAVYTLVEVGQILKISDATLRRWLKSGDAIHVVEPGEFILGYPDNHGFFPTTPTVAATEDPGNMLPLVCSIHAPVDHPAFERTGANRPHDLGSNGSFLVIRQLEQDVEAFNAFVTRAASEIKGRPGTPAGFSQAQLEEWVAAKLVGRWRDGTSLVRFPHRLGTGWQHMQPREADNEFLLGKESIVRSVHTSDGPIHATVLTPARPRNSPLQTVTGFCASAGSTGRPRPVRRRRRDRGCCSCASMPTSSANSSSSSKPGPWLGCSTGWMARWTPF